MRDTSGRSLRSVITAPSLKSCCHANSRLLPLRNLSSSHTKIAKPHTFLDPVISPVVSTTATAWLQSFHPYMYDTSFSTGLFHPYTIPAYSHIHGSTHLHLYRESSLFVSVRLILFFAVSLGSIRGSSTKSS